jgi:hypothetical protein
VISRTVTAADAARARHNLSETRERAFEGHIVERIGNRGRRQLRKFRHNVLTHGRAPLIAGYAPLA